MASTIKPPSSPIPPHLQHRFKTAVSSVLEQHLAADTINQHTISTLGIYLSHRAAAALNTSQGGEEDETDCWCLSLLLRVSQEEEIPLQLIVDGIISYPLRSNALKKVIVAQLDKAPSLIDDLTNQILFPLLSSLGDTSTNPLTIPSICYILLAHSRAHPSLTEALVKSTITIPSLRTSYNRLSSSALPTNQIIQTKTHILLLLNTILLSLPQTEREWKLVSLSDDDVTPSNKGNKPLVDQELGEDYVLFFGGGIGEVGEETIYVLKSINGAGHRVGEVANTDERNDENRIAPILALFPHIPSRLLVKALHHPTFSSGSGSDIENLTNALLEGTLPSELDELKEAIGISESSMESGQHESIEVGDMKRIKRDNIFDDMPMDFSKLKLGKETDDISSLTAGIPDHIRASILRLSEQQAEEEEEEMRIEREEAAYRRERAGKRGESGRGGGEGKSNTTASRPEREEMESEDENETEDERAMGRGVVDDGEDSDEGGDILAKGIDGEDESDQSDDDDPETICEIAYIRDPKLFDRDSVTRRSKQRADLKERTGWSDEQLEGWRIMLEKNPRKDKILEQHSFGNGTRGPNNYAGPPPPRQDAGGGGGGGGRGRGRGGGGGGHRGSGSKSSRGHQNATRTRGHDRKMQRMGGA